MTYREFRRTDLHNEFYRPMGIPYGIGSGISFMQDCLIGVGLHRSGKDYSERDRRMLSELQPHMLQAYKNSQAVTRLHQETAAYLGALDTLDAAIACLSPQLTIQWMTPSAERVLTAYGLIARRRIDRLCRSLIEWVRAQEALLSSPAEALRPPRPCSIPSATGTLMIRLLRHGSLRLLLLEDHRAAPSLAALAALGLSPRETEILGWVAQGKTNPEIGIILGISPRTAQKHLERIYIKLGVENRHAAITMAMDAMRQERNGKNYD
ncbi:MAG: hypothetical protein IT389_04675 [Nitrospira sp.]|nr:hypothetical protein [Nitrospira sp.]